MVTYNAIYGYMISVMSEYTDHLTDEINITLLAEDAYNHFNRNIHRGNYEIPDIYYDVAFEVAVANGLNTY